MQVQITRLRERSNIAGRDEFVEQPRHRQSNPNGGRQPSALAVKKM
jgi:hypothetical protein